jgi:hypothetical protein
VETARLRVEITTSVFAVSSVHVHVFEATYLS